MEATSVLDFVVDDISGQPVKLSRYKGQVLLIVNAASKCGFTPQYKGLQELYERYRDRGFVVLGFPSNDFLHQEPGDNAAIKSFCELNYGVTFPMFAKISVKGENAAPLYKFLVDRQTNPESGGRITWNFNKFLIGRDGRVVNRFGSMTGPLNRKVTSAIEAALAVAATEK